MNIAFYSYKGGVGRTQLVANLASYLCMYENKKVLLMDWDLEAPGLHFYFQNAEKYRNFQNADFTENGLIEVLNEYVKVVRGGNPNTITKEMLPKFTKENIVSLVANQETGGKIDLIPAGIYADYESYRRKIIDFNWFEFYEMLDGIRYLEFMFKPQLKELGYDFVLIDSRTGISDYQNICNIQLADANMIVIAPNMQNLEGCLEVANSIIASPYIAEGWRKPIVMPILSRAEEDAPEFKNFHVEYQRKCKPLIEKLNEYMPVPINIDKYYADTLLHYNKFIAVGEHQLFGLKINKLGKFEQKIENITDYLLLYYYAEETKDANQLSLLAKKYRTKGKLENAKILLKKALDIDSKHIESLLELVSIHKQENNDVAAKFLLLELVEQRHLASFRELTEIYRTEQNVKALENILETGFRLNFSLDILIDLQKDIRYVKLRNPIIQKALSHLQNANYAGYFEEMDKVVPAFSQNPYQEHKGKFMSGNYPYNFYQILEVFAKEVDRSLSEKVANANNQNTNDNNSNPTKMNRTEKEIQGLEDVLDLLIDKKNYFRKQLQITSDADAKFGLQQKLKDLEKEIAQYKAEADKIAKEVVSKNNSTVSGNGNFVFQGIENATINVSVVNNLTEKFEKLDKEVKEMQAEKTSILLEADKQRIADIKQQLVRMNKLKSEWEEKEMLSDNPKEKMKAELEIAKLKEKMDELRKELSSF